MNLNRYPAHLKAEIDKYPELLKARLEADGNLNFIQEVDSLKDASEEFSMLWNRSNANDQVRVSLVKSEKSEMEADRLRNEGNSFYKKRNFVKALELYNESIRHAPHPVIESLIQQGESTCNSDSYEYPKVDPRRYGGTVKEGSEALAKGYSNRSALLYEIKCYDKCLADIDLAFESGCPEELSMRLTKRKEKCLKALKENLPLKIDLHAIIERLHQFVCDEPGESTRKWKFFEPDQKAESMYHKLHNEHLVDILSLETLHLPSLKERNPSHPALSSGVTVAYFPTKGRGIVATKDLKPGDVIGIERSPFTFIKWKYLDIYCSYCLQICLTPVPCPSCCQVIYCGNSCRIKGLSEHHWLQCIIMSTLIPLNIPDMISLVLMKCLRFSQLKEMVLKLREEKVTSPEMAGCNSNGLYSSTSYQIIHHLRCQPTTVIHPSERLGRLKMAVTLTSLLLDCGRFFLNEQYERVIPSQEDIILTGSVLYSFMMKFHANGMNICDVKLGKTIGGSIYPTLTLLNHACNANAGWSDDEGTTYVMTKRFIKAGEEITIPYAGHFSEVEQTIRQKNLIGFGFYCKCEACINRWPGANHQPLIYCKCWNCSKEIKGLGFICDDCVRGMTKRGVMNDKNDLIKKQEELMGYLHRLDAMARSIKVTRSRLLTETQASFVLEAANKLCKHLLEPCLSLSMIMSLILAAFPCIRDK